MTREGVCGNGSTTAPERVLPRFRRVLVSAEGFGGSILGVSRA